MQQLRALWQRPLGKIIAGIAAFVIVCMVVVGIYIFGGGSPVHNKLTTSACAPVAGDTAFTIDDSASEASFTLTEVLAGNNNTVVGKTNQVAGQININAADVSQSQICKVTIDLSSMLTDSDLRNNALQGRIFETSDPRNQFATFVTTAISGLPSAVAVGQTVNFTITGNLTLHQVTKSETFAATVTATSATALIGTAKTTVRYSDFNLAIPNVPSVSDVSNDVILAIGFTAKA